MVSIKHMIGNIFDIIVVLRKIIAIFISYVFNDDLKGLNLIILYLKCMMFK